MDKDFQTFEEKYMEEHEGEIVSVYDRHAGLVDGAKWGIDHVKKSQEIQHDPESCKENGNSLTCSGIEELEKAAVEAYKKIVEKGGVSFLKIFKAGAEWYASHNTKLPGNLLLAARKASIDMCDIDDKHLDEYPYHPIAEQKFIEGANWQKEQMMKDAIDATKVFSGIGSNSKTGECVPYTEYKICISDKLCNGLDKVKLIIIKEKSV